MNKPPFKRTTCACPECVQCCKEQPGPLIEGDLERIASHLGKTSEEAKQFFWASPGAIISAGGQLFRIGTITPRRENGRCVLLDANDRCTVHPVAPAGCAYFDTHMGTEEGQARGNWAIREQLSDEYQKLRDELPAATSYNPHPYAA